MYNIWICSSVCNKAFEGEGNEDGVGVYLSGSDGHTSIAWLLRVLKKKRPTTTELLSCIGKHDQDHPKQSEKKK